MGNLIRTPDENLLKVHPDLAALYREIEEKERAIRKLKAQQKLLKEGLKATKHELSKRLTVIQAWQSQREQAQKPNAARQRPTR